MTVKGAQQPNKPNKVRPRTRLQKCRAFLTCYSQIFELQTEAVKLIVYNLMIVLQIANEEIGWRYPFEDVELANRLGVLFINPDLFSKFGFVFRLLTVLLNACVLLPVIRPQRKFRRYVLVGILWNFYTLVAIGGSVLDLCWTMFMLEVPINHSSNIFMVGVFMVCLQTKLTLQVLRFYEYLNYMP